MKFLLFIFLSGFVVAADKDPGVKVAFSLLKDYKLPIKDPTYAEKEELSALIKAVPKKVLKYDGKRVKISGFMVPLKLDKQNKVPLFLLAPDQTSCCYGAVPNLNGFIYCRSSKGFEYKNDIPIEVTGVITTRPFYDKNEDCVLIYMMVPESIKVLKALDIAKKPAVKKPTTPKEKQK